MGIHWNSRKKALLHVQWGHPRKREVCLCRAEQLCPGPELAWVIHGSSKLHQLENSLKLRLALPILSPQVRSLNNQKDRTTSEKCWGVDHDIIALRPY